MRRALVCVFLRGGADGLALVPPYDDPLLRELRPSLCPDGPGESDSSVIDLDGRFGLHPSLKALAPAFAAGELAIVHAVGSDDQTRSHFEAQDRMELAGETATSASGGWLARHLATRPGPRAGALAAVAFGPRPPECLRGAAATALEHAADFGLDAMTPELASALEALYQAERAAPLPLAFDLWQAGTEALRVMGHLATLGRGADVARDRYPSGALGARLAEAAHLLRHRDELGIEAVTIDHDGYDTHFVQADSLAMTARELGDGLAALRADLGEHMHDIIVIVMTEFGRRVAQNVSLGTDHGRAGVMMLLGGPVRGGRVYGDFPGLAPDSLEPPGDLRVTTDYRTVLEEVISGGLANPRSAEVFPRPTAAARLGVLR